MEIGILILIILGSFIFKKGNSKEELPQKPVPSKDMTWEEMEEYYGITLSRDPEESVNMEIVGTPLDIKGALHDEQLPLFEELADAIVASLAETDIKAL